MKSLSNLFSAISWRSLFEETRQLRVPLVLSSSFPGPSLPSFSRFPLTKMQKLKSLSFFDLWPPFFLSIFPGFHFASNSDSDGGSSPSIKLGGGILHISLFWREGHSFSFFYSPWKVIPPVQLLERKVQRPSTEKEATKGVELIEVQLSRSMVGGRRYLLSESLKGSCSDCSISP